VLCGFMPEESAFCTMAAMVRYSRPNSCGRCSLYYEANPQCNPIFLAMQVEDCHISDFLSRAPPPLLGYQATTAAMAQLSDKVCRLHAIYEVNSLTRTYVIIIHSSSPSSEASSEMVCRCCAPWHHRARGSTCSLTGMQASLTGSHAIYVHHRC